MAMTANGLTKLLEELGELAQVAAKKQAYFHTDAHPDGGGSLKERMEHEMGDVSAAMRFVQQQFGLDRDAIEQRARAKLALFEQWHADAANGADAYTARAAR
jgi:NTP pyrophosphatase (non-canonical NTP hydrolase)